MARTGGLMDRNVPSQLDEADLAAEIEIELPGSMDDGRVQMMMDATGVGEIEITPTEDGGVDVDFDPSDQRGGERGLLCQFGGGDAGAGVTAYFWRAFVGV